MEQIRQVAGSVTSRTAARRQEALKTLGRSPCTSFKKTQVVMQ